MMDRVKESVFAALGSAVQEAAVADLYAGSGSLGLEALSRGAASAVFVESDRHALRALRSNVETVGLGGEVLALPVEVWVGKPGPGFDLAFVDPPYGLPLPSVVQVLEALVGRLCPAATVVVHRRAGSGEPSAPGLVADWQRRYGGAEITRLKKEEP